MIKDADYDAKEALQKALDAADIWKEIKNSVADSFSNFKVSAHRESNAVNHRLRFIWINPCILVVTDLK